MKTSFFDLLVALRYRVGGICSQELGDNDVPHAWLSVISTSLFFGAKHRSPWWAIYILESLILVTIARNLRFHNFYAIIDFFSIIEIRKIWFVEEHLMGFEDYMMLDSPVDRETWLTFFSRFIYRVFWTEIEDFLLRVKEPQSRERQLLIFSIKAKMPNNER